MKRYSSKIYEKQIRMIAWVTCILFMTESVLLAAPGTAELLFSKPFSPAKSIERIAVIHSEPQRSAVAPQHLHGEITATYKGEHPYELILIQDAHLNEEAQLNISNLLQDLSSSEREPLIGIEGATGELQHGLISNFPNKKVRKIFANKLLQDGWIGGAEYFTLTKKSGAYIFGAEQTQAYEKNKEIFLQSLEAQMEHSAIAKNAKKYLKRYYRLVLNENLEQMIHYQDQFEESENLIDYFEFIYPKKLKLKNDLQTPQMDLFQSLLLENKELAPSELKKEIEAFKSDPRISKSVKEKVKRLHSDGKGEYEVIHVEDIDSRYPQIRRWIGVVKKQKKLDAQLFTELSEVSKHLIEAMTHTREEANLITLIQVLRITERLLSFKLQPQDAHFFENNGDLFDGKYWNESILALHRAHHSDLPDEEANPESLWSALHSFFLFYEWALRRDQLLLENVIAQMEKQGKKRAYLVIGGFHAPGIEAELRKKDISFTTLRPNIQSGFNPQKIESLYKKRMHANVTGLEEVFKGLSGQDKLNDLKFQLLTPRIFSTKDQNLQRQGFLQTGLLVLAALEVYGEGLYSSLESLLKAPISASEKVMAVRSLAGFEFSEEKQLRPGLTFRLFRSSKVQFVLYAASNEKNTRDLYPTRTDAMHFDSEDGHYVIKAVDRDEYSVLENRPNIQKREEKRIVGDEIDDLEIVTSQDARVMGPDEFKEAVRLRLNFYGIRNKNYPLSSAGLDINWNEAAGDWNIEIRRNLEHPGEGQALLILLEEFLELPFLFKGLEAEQSVKMFALMSYSARRILKMGYAAAYIQEHKADGQGGDGKNIPYTRSISNILEAILANKELKDEGSRFKAIDDAVAQSLAMTNVDYGRIVPTLNDKRNEYFKKIDLFSSGVENPEFWTFYIRYISETNQDIISSLQKLMHVEGVEKSIKKKISGVLLLSHLVTQQQPENESSEPVGGIQVEEVALSSNEVMLRSSTTPTLFRADRYRPKTDTAFPNELWSEYPKPGEFAGFSLEELLELQEKILAAQQAQPALFSMSDKTLDYLSALKKALDSKLEDSEPETGEAETASVHSVPSHVGVSTSETSAPEYQEKSHRGYLATLIVEAILYGGAAFMLGFNLPALTLALSAGVVFRVGWNAGVLSNEWSHLVVGFFTGNFALTWKNLLGNKSFFKRLVSFLPFSPLYGGKVQFKNMGKVAIGLIRVGGWFLGIGAGIVYWQQSGFLVPNTPFAWNGAYLQSMLNHWMSFEPLMIAGFLGWVAAGLVSFFSDVIFPPSDVCTANCGNLGKISANDDVRGHNNRNSNYIENVVTEAQRREENSERFLKQGNVIQVRGGQAGGYATYHKDKHGRIYPVLNKVVNTKRGKLPKAMADAMDQTAKTHQPAEFDIVQGHVRFATLGLPSEIETHPHQWTPTLEKERWIFVNGRWEKESILLANIITHNGDFDELELLGAKRSNGDLGIWLQSVLGVTNITGGDSPKIAGVMDFFITKGMWDASVRYAYQMFGAEDFYEAVEGKENLKELNKQRDYNAKLVEAGYKPIPLTVHADYAPTPNKIKSIATHFDRALTNYLRSHSSTDFSKTKERESLKSYLIAELSKTPEMQSFVSQEKLESFIGGALNAFLDQDVNYAVRKFAHESKGTFGLVVTSTTEPNKVNYYAGLQPLSLGFDRVENAVYWSSETATLKVPLDETGRRMSHRVDLLQDEGEVVQVTMSRSEKPKLSFYSKRAGRDFTMEDMQKNGRIIDMWNDNPYIRPLEILPEGIDLVERDLRELPQISQEIRESWANENSFNRRTSRALMSFLLEKHIGKRIKRLAGVPLFGKVSNYVSQQSIDLAKRVLNQGMSEQELEEKITNLATVAVQMFTETHEVGRIQESEILDPVDVLIVGMENNIWLGEGFSADLKRMFPKLRVSSISANKVLDSLKNVGLERPIKEISISDNGTQTVVSKNTLVINASHSGQNFAPLNAMIALQKLIGNRVFVMSGEMDTKMGALVQNFYASAPFRERIFETFPGKASTWRPGEASVARTVAMEQTFTELLIRLGQDMRSLLPESSPLGMDTSQQDFRQMHALLDEHVKEKTPDLSGYDLEGKKRETEVARDLKKWSDRWGAHIKEKAWVWYTTKIIIFVTVTFGIPFTAVITGLFPAASIHPYLLGAVNATIYMSLSYILTFAMRLFSGRETMHRQGTRSVLIEDNPKVHQIAKQYLTKLVSQAAFLSDIFVDSSNPADHGAHREPHRVRRGGLVAVGVPDGRLVGMGNLYKNIMLFSSQAFSIQSLPFQRFHERVKNILKTPLLRWMKLHILWNKLGFHLVAPELVTFGYDQEQNEKASYDNVFLGVRRTWIEASLDELFRDLAPILKKDTSQLTILEAKPILNEYFQNLNELAAGKDFREVVLLIRDDFEKLLKLKEENVELLNVVVERYLRRHMKLTTFYENRIASNQRLLALYRVFHDMVAKSSKSKLPGVGHNHDETQSHLAVATTASVASGADVGEVSELMVAAGIQKPTNGHGKHETPFEVETIKGENVSFKAENASSAGDVITPVSKIDSLHALYIKGLLQNLENSLFFSGDEKVLKWMEEKGEAMLSAGFTEDVVRKFYDDVRGFLRKGDKHRGKSLNRLNGNNGSGVYRGERYRVNGDSIVQTYNKVPVGSSNLLKRQELRKPNLVVALESKQEFQNETRLKAEIDALTLKLRDMRLWGVDLHEEIVRMSEQLKSEPEFTSMADESLIVLPRLHSVSFVKNIFENMTDRGQVRMVYEADDLGADGMDPYLDTFKEEINSGRLVIQERNASFDMQSFIQGYLKESSLEVSDVISIETGPVVRGAMSFQELENSLLGFQDLAAGKVLMMGTHPEDQKIQGSMLISLREMIIELHAARSLATSA